jgi:hypothetical protein
VRLRLMHAVLLAAVAAAVLTSPGVARGRHASAVPASVVGCWSRHVPALPVGTSAGVWLIRIRSNGAFAAYTPGSTRCDGAWDFTSHVGVGSGRLTIGHVPVCSSNGVYAVATKLRSLTLRKVSDAACPARSGLLVGTWKRTG